MIYYGEPCGYHRYDNCPYAIEARRKGLKEILPVPRGLPVCPYCDLMGKISLEASALIDEKVNDFRDALLDRAIRIAAKKRFLEVNRTAVDYAEAEYFDEKLRERGEDDEADLWQRHEKETR